MKIIFDGRMLNMSGIGRYSESLLNALFKILDENNEINILTTERKLTFPTQTICRSRIFSFQEQIELPLILKRKKFDIFHSPHFVFPLLSSVPTILTVHDITPILFPNIFSKYGRGYMKAMLKLAKRKVSKVITVSEHTKKDLIYNFGFQEEKIKTIYNGIDNNLFNIKPSSINFTDFKIRLGIPNQFLFYAGNIRPHKNLETLINGLNVLKHEGYDFPLVISGERKNSYKNLDTLIEKLGLSNRIIFTGWVSNEELKCLYQNATVFIYPSLYEGFGFPPLEAMACGTPVVTTNISSLPEVVGDAAITFSPYNIEELTNAVKRIIDNKDLRNELVLKGIERVNYFDWGCTAQKVLQLYKEVIEEKN